MSIRWFDGFGDFKKANTIKQLSNTFDLNGNYDVSKNYNQYIGVKSGLPSLSIGKYGFCTDTLELYIGTGILGNQLVWSGESPTQTDTTAPNDVTNLTIETITASSILMTWTKSTSSDVANYEVSYSTNGSSFTVASNLINSSSTSYTLNGLSASTNYTVRVVVIDQVGNRSTGVTKTATTSTPSDTTSPNDVTNITTSNVTSSSLTLSWTASNSSDIASYDVYQGSTLLGNTTNTTYNVSSLSASTQYTFKIVAKDISGNASTGVSLTVTTTDPPSNIDGGMFTDTITSTIDGGAFNSSPNGTAIDGGMF